METRKPSTPQEKQVKVYRESIFVVTKYFIAELSHTIIVGSDADCQDMVHAATVRPDPTAKMLKDGTGSKIAIEGLYLLKHLAFTELLNKSVLILGFKYN